MDDLGKMGALIERVRTPLALAGLVVVALYGIYRQILQMDIFAEISADQTFMLVDRILWYLFLLALTAVVLGVLGYLWSSLVKSRVN